MLIYQNELFEAHTNGGSLGDLVERSVGWIGSHGEGSATVAAR